MKLRPVFFLVALLFSVSACSQTEGHYVSVRTITDVFFQDTILNIVTSDTTFRDTLLGTGGGGVVGPATQTLDTIDFDFLTTEANLPVSSILNFNLTAQVAIPWSTSPVRTSSRYTISGSNVSVSVTGWYRVSGYLTTNPSTNQRYNGKVFLKKNGTLSDEWTATGYSRNSNSQNETSLYFEFYTLLTAGDPFQIIQICEGGQLATPTVTLNNSASRLYVMPLTQNFVELASGPAGAAGTNGLSAYEIWLAQSNTGTEADFLASLEGAQGPAGPSGGPVGPAGPAGASGVASDTSGNGYFYRLFANDKDDGFPYYDNNANHNFSSSGYTGVEFYNPTLDINHRIYTLGFQGLYVDGFTTFVDGFSTDHFQSNSNGGVYGLAGTPLLISDNAGLRIRDFTAGGLGLFYEQDLSTTIKANPRSVPDVGTVQEMIDAGGGSAPLAPFQQITSATTISPTKGTSVEFTPSSNATLTINPVNLDPGDVILLFMNNDNADPTFGSTTGLFYGSAGFGTSTVSYTAGDRAYLLIWAGTNWHYTQF
jgi:hypothetical protein